MNTIGQLTCAACGAGRWDVHEGKGGILTATCTNSTCKAQFLVRSPQGVRNLHARLAPDTGKKPEPATTGKKPDDGDDWLSKL